MWSRGRAGAQSLDWARPVTARRVFRQDGGMTTDRQRPLRVLLAESIHPDAVSELEAAGMEVETVEGALSEAALHERLPEVDMVGIRSRTQLSQAVLEA